MLGGQKANMGTVVPVFGAHSLPGDTEITQIIMLCASAMQENWGSHESSLDLGSPASGWSLRN